MSHRAPLAGLILGQVNHGLGGTVNVTQAGTLYLIDATAGATVVQLPAVATLPPGFVVGVKKWDATGNAVTVTPAGADTIDGGGAIALGVAKSVLTIYSTGIGWQILARYL